MDFCAVSLNRNAIVFYAVLYLCRLASKLKNVHGVSRLRTELLKASHLACLSVQVMNVELLELAKPTHVDNDFDDVVINKKGEAVAHCSRFKTRIRPSMQVRISCVMEFRLPRSPRICRPL